MKFNVYATSGECLENNTLRRDYGKVLSKYGAEYHYNNSGYLFERRWECTIELNSLEDMLRLLAEIREHTQQDWIKLIVAQDSILEIYDDFRE